MKINFRNTDPKNIAIGILAIIVALETFFLFIRTPQKITTIETQREPAVEYGEVLDESVVGRIALIIDDWGYNARLCNALNDINIPLAIAILPNLKQSSRIAQCAHRYGKTVMVHLPLEPHRMSEKYPEDYVIETSMKKEKIESILIGAIDSVPYATGVNNHMGSKATEDRYVIKTIFSVLRNKGLFFTDSLVTSNSVCKEIAQQMQLPFAERNIFLDNKQERSYIEGQFVKLAKRAKKHGLALGVGHAKRLTLQIIREQIPLLEEQGFQFISVEDLIRSQR